MAPTITFLGAAGTVTGSKYLVRSGDTKILVDCGLFQGEREWREKNWCDPDIDLTDIDLALLTHAHIDHTGLLPRYHRLGLNCPVLCSKATAELLALMLPDSGRLQEEEASYRQADKKRSRHQPPLPLYTEDEAKACLRLLRPIPFHKRLEIAPGIFAEWSRMGHIIGAGAIRLEIGGRVICFSGDVGRYTVPILKDPEPLNYGDLLLVEGTYGDKLHGAEDPKLALARVVGETAKRGGVVLIPSFAVGRTQLLLFYLRELKASGQIPDIPVIVDSPMATDATTIYRQNPEDYDEEALGVSRNGNSPFALSKLRFTQSTEESKKLNDIKTPMIIISASGMLTGGRVLHHLRQRIGDDRNTVLFVGYQSPGSRGAWLKGGAKSLRIFREEVAVRAHIEEISGLSAHGDQSELTRWCQSGKGLPGKIAIVHSEPDTAKVFKAHLEAKLGWKPFIASYLQELEI